MQRRVVPVSFMQDEIKPMAWIRQRPSNMYCSLFMQYADDAAPPGTDFDHRPNRTLGN